MPLEVKRALLSLAAAKILDLIHRPARIYSGDPLLVALLSLSRGGETPGRFAAP